MRKNQQGFSLILIIVILLFIAGVGLAAYWVFWKNKNLGNVDDTSNSEIVPQKPESEESQITNSEDRSLDGYAVIEEWKIKIAMRDYDKFTFEVSEESISWSEATSEGSVTPSFKPQYLQDKSCLPGLALYRYKTKPAEFPTKKIGEYYYQITGSPYRCNDDPNSSDHQLGNRFVEDFSIHNISTLDP